MHWPAWIGGVASGGGVLLVATPFWQPAAFSCVSAFLEWKCFSHAKMLKWHLQLNSRTVRDSPRTHSQAHSSAHTHARCSEHTHTHQRFVRLVLLAEVVFRAGLSWDLRSERSSCCVRLNGARECLARAIKDSRTVSYGAQCVRSWHQWWSQQTLPAVLDDVLNCACKMMNTLDWKVGNG